ncbi:MAG: hypothetical protein H6556_13955 [Lewinellaceae bacterium]|nr:hypothetical protein [Lewinellaceae bacterium]
MMDAVQPWFWIFVLSGAALATALFVLAGSILRVAWQPAGRPAAGGKALEGLPTGGLHVA